MRHKMMINEFIGRRSSNKGWRAPVRTRSLAAALNTAGVRPPGAQRPKGVSSTAGFWPWALSLTLLPSAGPP